MLKAVKHMKFLRQTAVPVWNVLPDFRRLTSSPSSGIHLDEYQMAETLSVSCVGMQSLSILRHVILSAISVIHVQQVVPDDGDIVSFRNVENQFRFNTSDR
jgi:hypothetical protein